MVLPEREDPECAANRRRDEPRCRYAAREGTALPCRMSPTFLLSCQKKSRRRSGGKEKRYQPNLHTVQVWGNGFCENCCAGEELRTKSRAGCRACPALYAVLIVASNLKVQIGHPLLLFPLPLPLILRGVSKGESTKAPPGADKARCFRGNGTIGGPSGPGIV